MGNYQVECGAPVSDTTSVLVNFNPWRVLESLDLAERVKWMRAHGMAPGSRGPISVTVGMSIDLLVQAGGNIRPDGGASIPEYLNIVLQDALAGIFLRDGRIGFPTPAVIDPFVRAAILHRDRADAEKKAEEERREAELQAQIEARQEQERLYVEEREAWTSEFGSDVLRKAQRLRLLDASDKRYRTERLELEFPGWHWDRSGSRHNDPRNPSEAALDTLEETRKTFPDAELVYVIEPEEWDGYEVCEEDRYMAVVATFLNHTAVLRVEEWS